MHDLRETHELCRQYSHRAKHKCMQLIGCFENGILCSLDAFWKVVLLGFSCRLKRKTRQAVSGKVVVDLTGFRGNDGCKLYYPTGRHRKPRRRAAKTIKRVGPNQSEEDTKYNPERERERERERKRKRGEKDTVLHTKYFTSLRA